MLFNFFKIKNTTPNDFDFCPNFATLWLNFIMEKMLQLENYSRLNFGILAHSPGADKNLFILDYLQHVASLDVFAGDLQENNPHTTCLFVSKSTIYQWHNFAKKYEQLKMVGLATLADLRTFKSSPHKYDLVIIHLKLFINFLFGHIYLVMLGAALFLTIWKAFFAFQK